MSSVASFCFMPVEPDFVPEVNELLVRLRAGQPAGLETEGGDFVRAVSGAVRRRHNDGGVVWSVGEYEAFMAAGKESYRRVRAFCDVLAGAPGRRFTTTAASDAAGITNTQLRAALGKFTTWMTVTIDAVDWPFAWAYGEEVDPENPTEFHYSMSDDQAKAWRAAREQYRE